MKTIKGFVKKYWITVLIFAGLVLLYYYVADVKMLNRECETFSVNNVLEGLLW